MLHVRNLTVEIGGKTIVRGATFEVRARDKVGLVGRNGAGKTTLFRVLGGAAEPHDGEVRATGGVGYLSQDPRVDDVDPATVSIDHILAGRGLDEARVRLEKLRLTIEEDASERNIERYSRALDAYEHEGGYAADAEVRKIAHGLGVSDDRLDRPIGVLSGGERRRVELSRILFAGSELLLLDEPTNHLDIDAKTWLMGFLRTYPGALLVISHDLDLLDESITRVIHIDREAEEAVGQVVEYKGTYTQYISARDADEIRQVKVATRQQAEITRLEKLADSMRGQTAKRAKTAKSLDTRTAKLRDKKVDAPQAKRKQNVRFPEPPPSSRTVLEVTQLAKAFGDLDVFFDVSFDVGRGERLLVMGLNGAGKTTLLKTIANHHEPDLGDLKFGTGVSAGYYAQEHEGISDGKSLLEHMRDPTHATVVRPGAKKVPKQKPLADEDLRALIGMFGLSGDKAFQDAGTLSGGEKTKLALAQLISGGHNLLLLDEPTNNLDPPSRTAVAQALAAWPGTMVIVSHDAEFVRELEPNKVLMLPEASLDYWNDSYMDLVEMA